MEKIANCSEIVELDIQKPQCLTMAEWLRDEIEKLLGRPANSSDLPKQLAAMFR